MACGRELDIVGALAPSEIIADGGSPLPASSPSGPAIDAAPVDSGACAPTVFVERFDTGFAQWTTYGGVELASIGGESTGQLIATGAKSRAAGLFWIPTVKATSFRATFNYYVPKPPADWEVGDGLTFTWLTSTGTSPLGADASDGQGLGLPADVTGYALALDGWQNSSINDLDAPSFNILALDPARGLPGQYDWHVRTLGPFEPADVYGVWRTIEAVVANGKVSATLRLSTGGQVATLFTDVPIDTSAAVTALGFTASTGDAAAAGYFVDTVTFELTNPSCK
ncbi:hypothetical protein AKJ09_05767 [Labilithrix luteola]|uniref:Uncharacterized protein n=1 Tax=Labilithrix luteola TaxID=1391654 RepID=A0A0K1PZZ5_9BACT|nr:hypothetical protein AKJ09_05767 [Labilithrix luteola]